MKNKIMPHRNFDDWIVEKLKDPKLALGYLNEALVDEDERVFLLAFKYVLAAQGQDMSALAKAARMHRPSVYRILSQKGNPRWNNITALFNTLGLQMQLTYKKQ